jgi:hypothetical protein
MKMTIIKSNTAFIETDCKIEHEGKSFESGGSFLAINKKTGKLGGILYACYSKKDLPFGEVTSWNGSLRIKAKFGYIFNSNFRDCQGFPVKRQYCWFSYQGHNFIGINYNVEWQNCITVREIK